MPSRADLQFFKMQACVAALNFSSVQIHVEFVRVLQADSGISCTMQVSCPNKRQR
jgi:hypothetical protein